MTKQTNNSTHNPTQTPMSNRHETENSRKIMSHVYFYENLEIHFHIYDEFKV